MYCEKAVIKDTVRKRVHDYTITRTIYRIPQFLICSILLVCERMLFEDRLRDNITRFDGGAKYRACASIHNCWMNLI
jgi:hypothetical protein